MRAFAFMVCIIHTCNGRRTPPSPADINEFANLTGLINVNANLYFDLLVKECPTEFSVMRKMTGTDFKMGSGWQSMQRRFKRVQSPGQPNCGVRRRQWEPRAVSHWALEATPHYRRVWKHDLLSGQLCCMVGHDVVCRD